MSNDWPPTSSSFDRLYLHMRSTCDTGSQVLMLASRVPNEGVTTVSVGMARAIANKVRKPVLYINAGTDASNASDMLGIPARPISFESITEEGMGITSELVSSSNIELVQLELPDSLGKEEKGALTQFIQRACLTASAVLVDAGSLTTQYPYIWSEFVSYKLLVIDSSVASSEEFRRLRDEAANANMEFNGFVLNKRRYYVPKCFYQRKS